MMMKTSALTTLLLLLAGCGGVDDEAALGDAAGEASTTVMVSGVGVDWGAMAST